VRVLTWNLYHGRALPPAGRSLEREFGDALAGWDWDVALLQEVPPWWPAAWPWAYDAVLTPRNFGLPVRRALATRWPDLMKSNGGGANAILVRDGFAPIAERWRRRLRLWPERRVAHGVRLGDAWVVNLHAQVHSDERACADIGRAAERWRDAAHVVFGGDMNVRRPRADGFEVAGGHDVDYVLVRGFASQRVDVLDRGVLSDHAAVLVELTRRLLLCGLGCLALAGCGSSSSSSSSGSTPAKPATAASSGGAVKINMQNIQFVPSTQTVKVGQKVTWVNQDTVDHNVTAKSGAKFASSTFGKGKSFTFTPTKAGTINYVCTIHPGMDGTLTVVAK
jgi:plastocyanin/endonuclease/exonuclease/phosphatase family metal-dependent hydrolase